MDKNPTFDPDFEGFAKAILEDWPVGDIKGV